MIILKRLLQYRVLEGPSKIDTFLKISKKSLSFDSSKLEGKNH